MITATIHSLRGAVSRLGVDPLTVNNFMEEWLKTAREVSFEDANKVAFILNKMKNCHYYLASDPMREDSQIVLIVKNNRVITLLTKLSNSFYGVPEAKTMNGTRMITTLGGEMVEDNGNWIKQLRINQKHQKSSRGKKIRY